MNTISPTNSVTAEPKDAGHRGHTRILHFVRAIVIGTILLTAAGFAYQVVATRMDELKYPAPGRMVDVDGFEMHLYCTGDGSPTVVLEPGGGSSSLVWYLIQPEIAATTRVCAYDRAGMGWSDSGPAPRDGKRIASELHTLLSRADIPGPYALAGWSYGGLFARSFAVQYPDDTAGLVLLDASHTDIWTRTALGQSRYKNDSVIYTGMRLFARLGLLRLFPTPFTASPESLPKQQVPQWKAVHNTTTSVDTTEAESRSIIDTMAQLRQAGDLGDLPLIVVTAGENQGADGLWAVYQDELAASLSTDSVHMIVEGAQHQQLVFDPEYSQASSSAILQMIEKVRAAGTEKP